MMALTPEEESLKAELRAELLAMVQLKLAVDHPLVLDWMERAANVLGKEQLEPNERWVHNPVTDELEKRKVQ